MVRDTKVEVEETEVDVVYCDVCDSECTDEYEVEPQDVCPSCAEGRSTFGTVREAIESARQFDSSEDGDDVIGFTQVLVMTIIWPIVFAVILIDGVSSDSNLSTADFSRFLLFAAGNIVWTALIVTGVLIL